MTNSITLVTSTSLLNRYGILMRIRVHKLFCGKSILKPRNDLQQLFQMIDLDQSGTIEVAEFIGPLSRWAHDSKTAPRFIKYNMLQTMHLQEDLYDLSVDCFRQLSMRVDELAHQISTLTMLNHLHSLHGSGGAHGPSHPPPDSGQDSLTQSSSLGLWTRQNTAQEQSPTASKTTSQEQIDQPRASVDAELFYPKSERETPERSETRDAYLESLLESSVAKLEAKLDLLLGRSRMKSPIPDVGLGSDGMDSWKAAGLQSTGLRSRKKPKMLHPEAFRSERCFCNLFHACIQLNDAECRATSYAFVSAFYMTRHPSFWFLCCCSLQCAVIVENSTRFDVHILMHLPQDVYNLYIHTGVCVSV